MFQGSSGVTLVMLIVEFLEQGLSTLSKAAMTKGMSNFVFVFYSHALAIFILLPVSLLVYSFHNRKTTIPRPNCSVISRMFLLGLLGCFLQLSLYIGIGYSSPTLASAMADLTPAFTFILAIISRMEKLELRIRSSQAKFIGTLVSIAGALTVTLYKGLPITGPSRITQNFLPSRTSDWIIGGFFLSGSAFMLSLLYILQTSIIKDYPVHLIVTLSKCIFTTLPCGIVALIVERNRKAWMLKLDIKLLVVVYSAVFATSLRNAVHLWACHRKGPIYVAMFKPLGVVIAIVMGVSLLGDTLYLGGVMGAATIAVGFYAVLWGKAQEEMVLGDESHLSKTSSSQTPLLNKHLQA